MGKDRPAFAPRGTPAAEVEIGLELVRGLLREQHPDLLVHEPQHIADGWDNSVWRLSEQLALRIPRREAGGVNIRHEQRWLPSIARRVSLPIPEPMRIGEPSKDYPWFWSVVRWTEGVPGACEPLRPSEAPSLAHFLAQVHTPAPPEAPANRFRGVPLAKRARDFERHYRHLEQHFERQPDPQIDFAGLRDTWDEALQAPVNTDSVWLHGDLHPKNVIVDDGRLASVIDWGDLTSGDPATDLAAAWMHLPPSAHSGLFESYGGVSAQLHLRARGWAALFGVILLDAGLADDPTFVEVGRTTLERLNEEERSPAP
jgi:aminoglycoside phosphotransferase (APT) family kinase protein